MTVILAPNLVSFTPTNEPGYLLEAMILSPGTYCWFFVVDSVRSPHLETPLEDADIRPTPIFGNLLRPGCLNHDKPAKIISRSSNSRAQTSEFGTLGVWQIVFASKMTIA
jgi:hypothetical protein